MLHGDILNNNVVMLANSLIYKFVIFYWQWATNPNNEHIFDHSECSKNLYTLLLQ